MKAEAPGFRIPWCRPALGAREAALAAEAVTSSWISGGPCVERFEAEVNARLGASGGLCVSNGTTALHLALLNAGVGPGDEVIVPNFTFVAPGNMVIALGATPVFADVDPDTWCLSPRAVERLITPKTKALLPVHLYGNMAPMKELGAIAKAANLQVVEDAAEAFMSRSNGQAAGTIGDFGSFSFHATKTIACGEGGFVTCRDPERLAGLRIVRDHGMTPGRRYWHEQVGFNFRLTNVQAAIGLAQLERIDEFAAERRRLYGLYKTALARVPGVVMQKIETGCDPVIWALAIRLVGRGAAARDAVMAKLNAAGIEVRPGFYPFSELPPYRKYAPRASVDVSREIAASVVALPFFVGLGDAGVAEVVQALEGALRSS